MAQNYGFNDDNDFDDNGDEKGNDIDDNWKWLQKGLYPESKFCKELLLWVSSLGKNLVVTWIESVMIDRTTVVTMMMMPRYEK